MYRPQGSPLCYEYLSKPEALSTVRILSGISQVEPQIDFGTQNECTRQPPIGDVVRRSRAGESRLSRQIQLEVFSPERRGESAAGVALAVPPITRYDVDVMETPAYNYRSLSFWLKMPILGPILCMAFVFVGMAVLPGALGGLFVWSLFAVGCIAIGRNVVNAARHVLRS